MGRRDRAALDALIVFAKAPVPGEVKTRLMPELSASDSAELYTAFLMDSLDQYDRIGPAVRLYVPDPDAFARQTDSRRALLRQRGGGLGERMRNAFLETFAAGYDRVVIVGTDHPSLPSSFLEMSFEGLRQPGAAVLGPAEDGGYYLLGMNDFCGDAFEAMSYSHPRVMEETLTRLTRCGRSVTVLPVWYDVDDPPDLVRLSEDLVGSPGQAPRTLAVLRRLAVTLEWLSKGL